MSIIQNPVCHETDTLQVVQAIWKLSFCRFNHLIDAGTFYNATNAPTLNRQFKLIERI